jgi:hypothetical protein
VDIIAQMDRKSTSGPHMDPMTDLAIHFPTLELINNNRGSEDRALCEASSKETEEGRLWDLPEIVSINTNDDDMPGRRRRTRKGGI